MLYPSIPPGVTPDAYTKAWTPPIQQGFHGGIAPRGRRSPGPRGFGEAARGRKAPGVVFFFENNKMPAIFWKVEGWRKGVCVCVFLLCFLCVFFLFGGGRLGVNWIWVDFVFSFLSLGNLKHVALLKSSLDVGYFSIASCDINYLMYIYTYISNFRYIITCKFLPFERSANHFPTPHLLGRNETAGWTPSTA